MSSRPSSFGASRNADLNRRLNLLALHAPSSNSPWYAFTLNNKFTPHNKARNDRLQKWLLLAGSQRVRCKLAGRNNKMRMSTTVVMRTAWFQFRRTAHDGSGETLSMRELLRCQQGALLRHDVNPENVHETEVVGVQPPEPRNEVNAPNRGLLLSAAIWTPRPS
jgi:hypothetical protein